MLDAMYIGRRIVVIHSPVFTRTFIITLLKQIKKEFILKPT